MDAHTDLPAGLTSRPATFDDVDVIVDLLAACELHDDGMVEVEASDLLSEWRRPGVDPARVSVLVLDGDHAVGFAEAIGGRVDAGVHPDHRGRGIGGALLRATWDISRAHGLSRVGQTVSDQRVDAPPLFRAHGYEPRRQAWIFEIPVDVAPPPVLPDGYVLRGIDAERDAASVHAVIEAAFAPWPDRAALTLDDWRARVLGHERFVADATPVVVRGDDVVGVAIGFDYEVEGWIEQLAVADGHRGLGLGGALLQEAFGRFRDRGRANVGLSTDSRTGARGVYEHVGMRLRRSYTHWSKALD